MIESDPHSLHDFGDPGVVVASFDFLLITPHYDDWFLIVFVEELLFVHAIVLGWSSVHCSWMVGDGMLWYPPFMYVILDFEVVLCGFPRRWESEINRPHRQRQMFTTKYRCAPRPEV
jgi:hypothetical protein